MTGAELIAKERDQFVVNNKVDGELALAAVCLASPELLFIQLHRANQVIFSDPWPWSKADDTRPTSGNMVLPNRSLPNSMRIGQLVRAGAYIAAEIDRLQREEAELVK